MGCVPIPQSSGFEEPTPDLAPIPTFAESNLQQTTKLPGIFLLQVGGMNELLPGFLDVNMSDPLAWSPYGNGAFIDANDALAGSLNQHGFTLLAGKFVVENPDGSRQLIENVAAYRDIQVRGFQVPIPERLIRTMVGGTSALYTVLLSYEQMDVDHDGNPELIGTYDGPIPFQVLVTIPINEDYSNLLVVSGVAGTDAEINGTLYEPGEIVAIIVQLDGSGENQLISALPLELGTSELVRARRTPNGTIIDIADKTTNTTNSSYQLTYETIMIGYPVRYADLEVFLGTYELRITEIEGSTWVTAYNDQGSIIRFPENVEIVNDTVVGYSERGESVWRLVIRNVSGNLEIEATRLPSFNWLSPENNP